MEYTEENLLKDNRENMIFCQSCEMPLTKDENFGTNLDGTKNKDYCAIVIKMENLPRI
jgi:hypothetical protein